MANKMTKVQMFEQIMAHTTDPKEKEFLAHEVELLKNKSANKKMTAEQIANAKLKREIVETMVSAKAYTVSEVILLNEDWVGTYSVNKFSALMNQLVDEEFLTKTSVKRVSYFQRTDKQFEDCEVEGD
jgi:hypothetical protein